MASDLISTDEVHHLAKLANLAVDEKFIPQLANQLSEILGFVGQLSKLDTSKVDPTAEITGLKNITQKSERSECLLQADALANAPKVEAGYVVVNGVFNDTENV
jgi:aspartyl-tRNA(Asn)/glutamyl-tRNA(Gln) amidotransferase subunit C